MKRQFLMLAHDANELKLPSDWFVSEKVEGVRAGWDGGISRGNATSLVPWANTIKDNVETIATGLWSRYGKVIYAPPWWLNELPPVSLDGELWIGRQQFQATVSTVKKHNPIDLEWLQIKFMVFDSPPYQTILENGLIDVPNMCKYIQGGLNFAVGKITEPLPFWRVVKMLENIPQNEVLKIHLQQIVEPWARLDGINQLGGEGIMLRNPDSFWMPERSHNLLKLKPFKLGVGTVVDWEPGKGKYEGMLGSLTVQFVAGTFNLSGFTDDERQLPCRFAVGSAVRFKYRELTDDGLPKEARYLR